MSARRLLTSGLVESAWNNPDRSSSNRRRRVKVNARRRQALIMAALLTLTGSCLAFAAGEWVIGCVGLVAAVLASVVVLRS